MTKQEYREGKHSIAVHQDEMYLVDDLIDATKSKPISNIQVKELSWIMKYTVTDKARVANASLQFPVIVLDDGHRKFVLDGVHRLKQAISVMERTIKAVVLTPSDMPLPIAHDCDTGYKLIQYTPGPLSHETKSVLRDFARTVNDGVTVDDLLKSPFIHLLCCENHKVGFVSFKILDNGVVHISALGVADRYRKHGYGYILLDEFTKLIMSRSNFSRIKLGVRADNQNAKKLYIRCGYKLTESGVDDGIQFDTFIYGR